MKVFYANENYAKYGYPGMNYFIALMGTAFYIMLTGFMVVFILMAAFPAFYKYYLTVSHGIPAIPSAIIILGLLFFLLRIAVKEESLKNNPFTKEYVNKAVNYLLTYAFTVGIIIVFLGLKFLRHYNGHM